MIINQIKEKNVYIYGDERFSRDFMYVFDSITIVDVFDDVESSFAKEWESNCDKLKENAFIIVCKYEKEKAICNLESAGYIRNKDYAIADSFFPLLDFPIKKISQERNVYIWGTGDDGRFFWSSYLNKHPEVQIRGFIDENKSRQEMSFAGYQVYSSQYVLETDKSAFFVIASRKYYWEISTKLKESGKEQDTDYVSYIAINSDASYMMRRTVYDVPKSEYLCPKFFRQIELKTEGRPLICGGMPMLLNLGVPLYYSEWRNVWQSNVMKVARLSAINGTYSFCNTKACSHMRESGNCEYNVNNIEQIANLSEEELTFQRQKNRVSVDKVYNAENYNTIVADYPDTFQFGWDDSCNLHCPSCRECVHVASEEENARLQCFTDRIYDLCYNHAKKVKIAGLGEAFASKQYMQMLFDEKFAKKVKSLGVLSNGLLATPDNMNRILEIWQDVNVFISMDGATAETAEMLRAGINFEKWKQNMNYISKLKREGRINKLAFNFVVQRSNFREMPLFAEMCLAYGADYIKYSQIFNWGSYSEQEFEEQISMFYSTGEPKEELRNLIDSNSIFLDERIHLFKWVNW
ncbi:MAG: hypothetical protein KBT19_03585 [Lachnospiraceae bacterium]|nr:hypothetical protein [Candidatus Colinaster equi]